MSKELLRRGDIHSIVDKYKTVEMENRGNF